jgi:hypothetical protein
VTGLNPTGTVTFTDGSRTLGAPTNLSAGSARLTTAGLAVGSHSISAAYSGDSNNAASTSPVVAETVNAVTMDHGGSGGRRGGAPSQDWSCAECSYSRCGGCSLAAAPGSIRDQWPRHCLSMRRPEREPEITDSAIQRRRTLWCAR